MEGFLRNALKTIRNDAGRKHKHVREACSVTLAKLDSTFMPQKQTDSPADQYFLPLKLACESNHPRIMCTALDCLQKLIAYGYLRGKGPPPEEYIDPKYPKRTLMDLVVKTICNCKTMDDDDVQLQVIKALLTAVSCGHCAVHETSLLDAVRSCYHIHLVSVSVTNKTTAKATLTQMLSIIFRQMEQFDMTQAGTDDTQAPVEDGDVQELLGERTSLSAVSPVSRTEAAATMPSSDDQPPSDDQVPSPSTTADVPASSDSKPPSDGFALGGNMYSSVAQSLQLPVTTASEDAPPTAVAPPDAKNGDAPVAQFHFHSLWHKDAFLLFRALCKLSMKHEDFDDDLDNPETTGDPIALRSKILSLDLLYSVLENAGPSFRSSDMFIFAIKQYLCTSLIKNCLASNTAVVGLSLRIFVTLQSCFKDDLKDEIELFIAKIFVKILESPYSPADHKILVLEVFMRICKDVNTLVEIFLNYDCDWDSRDLFSRTVQVLTKIATKELRASTGTGKLASQEASQSGALHVMALDSIVSILRSLAEYTHLEDQLPNNTEDDDDDDVVVADGNEVTVGIDPADGDAPHEPNGTANGGLDIGMEPIPNGLPSHRQSDAISELASDSGATFASRQGGGGGTSVAGESQFTTTGQNARTMNAVDLYQQKRKFRKHVQTAAAKFNVKPKHGIKYLVDNNLVADEPMALAQALIKFQNEFSKTLIGEYLGEDDEKNIEVMRCYVASFDFSGMVLDVALRHLLAGFRIPGEAQKIDRIIEQFAVQYCKSNPDVFEDVDSGYLLSFAIVMLNTDAHNDNIKPERKMTLKGFVLNTSDVKCSKELIEGTYERIVSNAISLVEDDEDREREEEQKAMAVSGGMFGNDAAIARKRKVAFSKQRNAMVHEAQQSLPGVRDMKNRHHRVQARFSAFEDAGGADVLSSNDHVRPMFNVVWGPMCAIFSVNLQNSEDATVLSMSIIGMQLAVRIAARFGMEDERKTLIDSISKFAFLDLEREMSQKNVDCVKALLEIATQEGDFLGTCWNQILLCTSQVARLQLYGSGGDRLGDDAFFSQAAARAPPTSTGYGRRNSVGVRKRPSLGSRMESQSGGAFSSFFSQPIPPEELARLIDEENGRLVSENIEQSLVDRIFLNSAQLSTTSIVHFVNALCEVSLMELNLSSKQLVNVRRATLDIKPRIFSLQRLVEVSDFNMLSRPRFIWGKMWARLSRHFAEAGCHENVSVSMYAIDSLRQLSTKFLERDELSGFNFQGKFLQPFQVIMRESKSDEQRELVMRCIQNIVVARASNIRSGWHCMLSVIALGGADQVHSIVVLSLSVLETIVENHFADVECVDDVTQCCLAFASNVVFERESIRAIELLNACMLIVVSKMSRSGKETMVRENSQIFRGGEIGVVLEGAGDEEDEDEESVGGRLGVDTARRDSAASNTLVRNQWVPFFVGLGNLVADPRVEVRTSAYETMFQFLDQFRNFFHPTFLCNVCRHVILPILNNVRNEGNSFKRSSDAGGSSDGSADSAPALEAVAEQVAPKDSQRFAGVVAAPVDVMLDDKDWASTTFHKFLFQFVSSASLWYTGVPSSSLRSHNAASSSRTSSLGDGDSPSPSNAVMMNGGGHMFQSSGNVGDGSNEGDAAGEDDDAMANGDDDAAEVVSEQDGSEEWEGEMSALFEADLLQDVLDLVKDVVLRDSPRVCRAGVSSLQFLIDCCESKFSMDVWSKVIPQVLEMMDASTPSELMSTFTRKWIGIEGANMDVSQVNQFTDEETASEFSQEGDSSEDDPSVAGESAGQLPVRRKSKASLTRLGSWEPEDVPYPMPDSNDPLPFKSSKVLTMCVVQLQLIRIAADILKRNVERVDVEDIMNIVSTLEAKASFGRSFNENMVLRVELLKRGFMKGSSLNNKTQGIDVNNPPNLLRQETLSTWLYFELLVILVLSGRKDFEADEMALLVESLHGNFKSLISQFMKQDRVLTAERSFFKPGGTADGKAERNTLVEFEAGRYVRAFSPVILQVVKVLLEVDAEVMKPHLGWLLAVSTVLVECPSRDIHSVVRRVFTKYLGFVGDYSENLF